VIATFQRPVVPGTQLLLVQDRDAAELLDLVNRNRDSLREWLPWVDRTHSIADVRHFVSISAEQWEAGLGPNCVIRVVGEIAGSIGCHPINWQDRSCSIGYWLDAARQGQGIVTRSCAVLMDYLFLELGLHRVEIRCGVGNQRSCAIPERLGFAREGVLRHAQWVNDRFVDLVVWSMLQPDWSGAARLPSVTL
jgi:ribosomal-protein-serine acetyltransferase